ncbi:MAG: hypothetical protein KKE17_03385, partial [Proteobacteria bacterium]|nr:hypothetical protein [Pseudomonadota bacterium]MBU1709027.1 hypothetical protein [Pseudomonadota bacterium]
MAFHSVINSLFVSPVHAGAGGQCIDPQTKFAASIERERARADRNGHGFSLIAYEVKKADRNKPSIRHLLNILPGRIRLTDEMGWIDKQQVGILLYSTTKEDAGNFARQIDASIISATGSAPRYVIHGYPSSTVGTGNLARKGPSQQAAPVKDSEARGKSKKTGHDIILTANHRMPKWKRMTDIAGASLGLMICAPVFML